MKGIKIEKLSEDQLKERGVYNWPIWECGPGEFEWEYTDKEACYILEGRVCVETQGGEVNFGKGDTVIFQKGLKCRWKVLEKVRKHYKFN